MCGAKIVSLRYFVVVVYRWLMIEILNYLERMEQSVPRFFRWASRFTFVSVAFVFVERIEG
jgi:hypothetical protein